jgi:hypothetical protein
VAHSWGTKASQQYRKLTGVKVGEGRLLKDSHHSFEKLCAQAMAQRQSFWSRSSFDPKNLQHSFRSTRCEPNGSGEMTAAQPMVIWTNGNAENRAAYCPEPRQRDQQTLFTSLTIELYAGDLHEQT